MALCVYVVANKTIATWLKRLSFAGFVVALVFVWWQQGAVDLAKFFEIGRGVDLFTYVALIGISFLLLSTQGKIRKLERMTTDLARHLAIQGATKEGSGAGQRAQD
ncbi:DUF2304 family protein [Pararobbsia alpina]